jgi:hypothetical protein
MFLRYKIKMTAHAPALMSAQKADFKVMTAHAHALMSALKVKFRMMNHVNAPASKSAQLVRHKLITVDASARLNAMKTKFKTKIAPAVAQKNAQKIRLLTEMTAHAAAMNHATRILFRMPKTALAVAKLNAKKVRS